MLSELQKHLCAYGVLIDHKANFFLIGNRRNQALELRFASIVKREACVDRGIYFGSCFVEILLETIKGSLESGEDVLVSGFGKFRVKVKKERRGRNPATGDDLMLESRKVVIFKCSHKLRDKINGGGSY